MSSMKIRMKKKKVLVLYVGGTFGMKKNTEGVLVPVANSLLQFLKLTNLLNDHKFGKKHFGTLEENQLVLPEFGDYVLLYEIKEYHPLLDSSSMGSDDWIRISKDIADNYESYDGFVIIHGTDTISYSAAALSFMLDGLKKPVIFTGSQVPIYHIRSDAKDNFVHSLMLAGCYNIPEVCVFASSQLSRGNRTIKTSIESFRVFESYNYHPLATTGLDIEVLAPAPNTLLPFMKKHNVLNDQEFGKKHFGSLQENQLVLPEIRDTIILYEIREYEPLLDSSDMGPDEWIQLAKDIGANYENYDGFVIIQGTDTLSYSAAALSFMLEGLQKPVVLTGSQIPIYEIRSDGRDNFLHSLIMAGCYNIPEVCVMFASKLLRGNRVTMNSIKTFNGFESFNYHPLANTGMEIEVHDKYIRKPNDEPFRINTDLNSKVAVLRFCPTLTAAVVEAIVKSPIEGLVMQTYGAGNLPVVDQELQKVFRWAVERYIILVNITQCLHGSVRTTYETGKWLAELGIANGRDMTCEAAVTKLCHVLGFKNLSYKEKFKWWVDLVRTLLK